MSTVDSGLSFPALQLDLERGSAAPATARAALGGYCDRCGVPSATRATVLLLASEIVTNAVVHPAPSADSIVLLATVTGDRIRVGVTDHGHGFTPLPRPPTRKDGGYGLHLVARESDDWGVLAEPNTTVWFEVDGCL